MTDLDTQGGQKAENYDYSLTIGEASAGNIEIDYTIRGNEEEGEKLYMQITELLKQHDEEHTERSPEMRQTEINSKSDGGAR